MDSEYRRNLEQYGVVSKDKSFMAATVLRWLSSNVFCFLYQEELEYRVGLESTESKLQFLQNVMIWNSHSFLLKLFNKAILCGKEAGDFCGKATLEENQGPSDTCSCGFYLTASYMNTPILVPQ